MRSPHTILFNVLNCKEMKESITQEQQWCKIIYEYMHPAINGKPFVPKGWHVLIPEYKSMKMLLPVLAKIQNQGCIIEMSLCLAATVVITKVNGGKPILVSFVEGMDLEKSIRAACIEYINWYNNNISL